MLRKSAIFLVRLHWGIYRALWAQLTTLCPIVNFGKLDIDLGIVVTKRIAYNEKFVHLQIGPCKCQYLRALGPNRE